MSNVTRDSQTPEGGRPVRYDKVKGINLLWGWNLAMTKKYWHVLGLMSFTLLSNPQELDFTRAGDHIPGGIRFPVLLDREEY